MNRLSSRKTWKGNELKNLPFVKSISCIYSSFYYEFSTKTMSKLCPNISSQSRPRSRRCSCPAERKKDGGKLDYDACADSYQSQTVKKNEKSLKLDGATSSVMFFGRRGKIKTFSIIPGIDFPFYLSTQTQSNKVCQKLLQRRVIFVISTISTNPYVKTCQTMLSEHWCCIHFCKKLIIWVLALFLPWSRDLPNMAVVRKSTRDLL